MDLIKLSIPPAFISERVRLTWREVLYGIDNELLAPGAAVDFAGDEIAAQDEPFTLLVDLAGMGKGEPTRALVEQLSNAEPQQDAGEIRDKWLYLALAWIFEHRASYPDPLQTVEEVYADFGYPPRIAGFVRYMPADEPDLGSRELNERRLHDKWRRYLDEASTEYAPSTKPPSPWQKSRQPLTTRPGHAGRRRC
jgi:hypothetical protein